MSYHLYSPPRESKPTDHNLVKQELFQRIHYVEGLTREFTKVKSWPQSKRQAWLEQNMSWLNLLPDSFMFNPDLVVNGMVLDAQAAQMSMILMNKLKEASQAIQQIAATENKLVN